MNDFFSGSPISWYISGVLTNVRVRWTIVLCALSVAAVLAAGIAVSKFGVSNLSPDKAETIVAIIDEGDVEAGRLSPWLISSENDGAAGVHATSMASLVVWGASGPET